MTDDERAALVERARHAYMDFHGYDEALDPEREREAFRLVVAVIEGRIRADERARVVAEATTDEAVERAIKAWARHYPGLPHLTMSAAIRAALGVPHEL